MAGNPDNIFNDPEFYRLNPQYTPADFNNDVQGNTAPLVVAGNSDMPYELTRWIESDPAARSFVQGLPDPWGMRVNTYFKLGQIYPASRFVPSTPGSARRSRRRWLAHPATTRRCRPPGARSSD